jgi:hypothetical protein
MPSRELQPRSSQPVQPAGPVGVPVQWQGPASVEYTPEWAESPSLPPATNWIEGIWNVIMTPIRYVLFALMYSAKGGMWLTWSWKRGLAVFVVLASLFVLYQIR